VHKPYAFKRGESMSNISRFILVVLVLNCVLSVGNGNVDGAIGWGAATVFFLTGSTTKREVK
jgi:hypothetical protein